MPPIRGSKLGQGAISRNARDRGKPRLRQEVPLKTRTLRVNYAERDPPASSISRFPKALNGMIHFFGATGVGTREYQTLPFPTLSTPSAHKNNRRQTNRIGRTPHLFTCRLRQGVAFLPYRAQDLGARIFRGLVFAKRFANHTQGTNRIC